VDISSALDAVRRLPPRASIAREFGRLRRDELDGSLALASTTLTREQIDGLVERGVGSGSHRLEHYLAARDLASAAAWVSEQRPYGAADPRPLMTVEDVRRLHAFATAGQPKLFPGIWRLAVDKPGAGIVSLPPWLIAKETAALVDRFRKRPPAEELSVWLATFLGRFARIRPFASANGRAGRLATALLLRRMDAIPLVIARDRVTTYRNALIAAENGDVAALATLIEDALLQSCHRLLAAAGDDRLEPLRALAGPHYAALIKAAKRGRLATVTREGRVYTTATWIMEYRNETRRDS
jgi:Fic family protein